MRISAIIIFGLMQCFLYSQTNSENTFENNLHSLTNFLNESDNLISDLNRIDSLYNKAIELTHNENEALLLLTFVTLPYREVPIQIPIFGIRYKIPLPSVNNKIFSQKLRKTPGKLFFDSPSSGDKDKVTHFFGNAFLAHSFGYFNISKFMGIFIELFESTFISSGEFDIRDFMVNGLGNSYGLYLRYVDNYSPGSVFKLYSLYFFRYYN